MSALMSALVNVLTLVPSSTVSRKTGSKIKPVVLAASVLLSPSAFSQSAGFEEVLVTGSHAPVAALTNTAAVLSAQEIRALGKRTVVELLQTLPGVLVEVQGGPGGLSAVSIRGGESNFTLVLLDGVPINDPTNTRGGSVDFANLSADLVERIEVVKGAQSAVYGSDALTGVINIITRTPEKGHQQRAHVSLGEDDYRQLGASASGRVQRSADAVHYVLELQDQHSAREKVNGLKSSVRDNRSANVRVGWAQANEQGHAVDLSYRFLEGDRAGFPEQSGGPLFVAANALERSDHEQHTASLRWRFSPTEYWASQLSVSRFEFEEVVASPGIVPFSEVPPLGSDSEFTRDLWRWTNTFEFAANFSLQAGIDLRDEKGSSEGFLEFFGQRLPTDFSLSRRTNGVFTSAFYSPTQSLDVQASLRFDDPEDFSSETSAALGFEWRAVETIALFANWGEAYKLPSFFALGHPLVGNALLEPEQATTWDLGVRWQAASSVSIEATGFFNEFRDLIDFDDAAFINVNRNEVESKGAELQVLWQPSSALNIRGQTTYTDLEVIGEDSVLTGRPEWTAGASVLWQASASVSGALDYRYVGKQWSSSRDTGESVTQRLGDYHKVDLTVSWQAHPQWQLEAMLDNA
ncbi:MAG: TonB-dependent receptor plug domain-containing protein, partial [Halioglobus sp.]